jgi:hypothetical protein
LSTKNRPASSAKLLAHKRFGVEADRITSATLPLSDLLEQCQGYIVGNKHVKPPPTVRIRLLMVQKLKMSVPNKFAANMVAGSAEFPLFGSSRLCSPPPVAGRVRMVVELEGVVMILELHRQGLSVSEIARRSGLDRKTVRRYVERGLEPPPTVHVSRGRRCWSRSTAICASASEPILV